MQSLTEPTAKDRCHNLGSAESAPMLDHLLVTAQRLGPSLEHIAALDSLQSLSVNADNRQLIDRLYTYWEMAHPEAGQPYWSVRSWIMLVWQPLYLTVIGAHLAGALPDLDDLQQRLRGGLVAGFNLSKVILTQPDNPQVRIETGGDQLRHFVDRMYVQLAARTPLKRLSALRLVADMLLNALAQIAGTEHWENARTMAYADQWLRAAGLKGESTLTIRSSGKESAGGADEQLVLERKSCCMHYRRHDGDLCEGCPVLKKPERLARLKSKWEARGI
ncbi:siderophore ferric iron reductase [Hydrocarboniclastica marina]|uniref:Siderophore ferric iron reductase n=1 Tax=Hydrocarboniclastica marina TaxID=2259620 RepID=A0A4P7XMZ1_9ALTE|nr:siderophore ferric iron reductase [Hydrocarboniclastica marina]MAM00360.1 siderophore ferric iron reductase [Alteromonadaceae bacterium]QCF27627.1 siderophore ferric iron reductase [Hydrocarboniclastica marina]|tara:strand:- start:373 stop:1200 length:828 start_codon:yes stop_codon:yes gene_type:complete